MRIGLQIPLEVDEAGRRGRQQLGGCRRQEEIGPVVVHRPRRQVRVARRERELADLERERAVPQEIGGEVGAIVAVAFGVRTAQVGVRRSHQRRDEHEHEEQGRAIGRRPLGHANRWLGPAARRTRSAGPGGSARRGRTLQTTPGCDSITSQMASCVRPYPSSAPPIHAAGWRRPKSAIPIGTPGRTATT